MSARGLFMYCLHPEGHAGRWVGTHASKCARAANHAVAGARGERGPWGEIMKELTAPVGISECCNCKNLVRKAREFVPSGHDTKSRAFRTRFYSKKKTRTSKSGVVRSLFMKRHGVPCLHAQAVQVHAVHHGAHLLLKACENRF